MKKKFVFSLTLALSAALLAGCFDISYSGQRDPNASFPATSETGTSSGTATEVDIFADQLPALRDAESWPIPYTITAFGEEIDTAEDAAGSETFAVVLFTNGFKADVTGVYGEDVEEAKFYGYHDDGMTYTFRQMPDYDEDEEEHIIVEQWDAVEDEDLEFFNSFYDSLVDEVVMNNFSLFDAIYSQLLLVVDQAAFDDLVGDPGDEFPEDAEMSNRFYKLGDEYIVSLTITFAEDDVVYSYEQKMILTFVGDLPGGLTMEVKVTADDDEYINRSTSSFTYTENRPAYNGPFMPTE